MTAPEETGSKLCGTCTHLQRLHLPDRCVGRPPDGTPGVCDCRDFAPMPDTVPPALIYQEGQRHGFNTGVRSGLLFAGGLGLISWLVEAAFGRKGAK